MNKKNKKIWVLVMILIVAGLGAGGQLLRANDDEASGEGAKDQIKKEEVQEGVKEEDKEPSPPKTQEQILQELLEEKSPEPMIITNELSEEVTVQPVASVDPKTKRPLMVREGKMVINRMGRLGKGAKGAMLFVYESDATALNEPPLILLPCLKLEEMEQITAKKPHAKFTVSGEITVYHGKGYLLLRKVMANRDLGQF